VLAVESGVLRPPAPIAAGGWCWCKHLKGGLPVLGVGCGLGASKQQSKVHRMCCSGAPPSDLPLPLPESSTESTYLRPNSRPEAAKIINARA
jgi:hypothetical protein